MAFSPDNLCSIPVEWHLRIQFEARPIPVKVSWRRTFSVGQMEGRGHPLDIVGEFNANDCFSSEHFPKGCQMRLAFLRAHESRNVIEIAKVTHGVKFLKFSKLL
jgi:hypothetical protein